MKFRNSFICFLLYFIRSITSPSTCATDSFYEECIVQDSDLTQFNNPLFSTTKQFQFISSNGVPFHNNSCLFSYHFTVNNFSDANYFNSRNRANELMQFDFLHDSASVYRCRCTVEVGSYLLKTNQKFNFYLTKLIR